MASVQPIVNQGPPMVEVKNIFFKAGPAINYFADEVEADAIDNETAFQHFNRSLECSNKHGCVLLTFNNSFYLIRVSDILSARKSNDEDLTFKDLKKLEIKSNSLPLTPNIISLSNGEDFLAVDTVKGDAACVVIFKFNDFLNQGGSCNPFCEIRGPSSSTTRVRSICWNPGEGMTNMMAVNTDDGSLYLAKILGPNNVELNKYAGGGVRCSCWSPKGKQLVVGQTSGKLCQLRLDLTEAKQIPGPEPGSIPVSILWTQTTQFLVVFHKENFIDFMQLDVPKGASPTYTNSGDIFISEVVPEKCSCYFLQLQQWNVVLAMTNSASDVLVLVKEQQNSNELWIPGDITDNRRAAFFLDNYARGASLYFGCTSQVTFSEVESYSPMPMVFLLSQRGSLLIYSIVNSDPQASPMTVSVSAPVPDAVVSSVISPSVPSFSAASKSQITSVFKAPQPSIVDSALVGARATVPPAPAHFVQNPQPFASTTKPILPAPTLPKFAPATEQPLSKAKPASGPSQAVDLRQLGTSTLPTPQVMAGLQKAVEEKRREMTTQLQKGSSLKGLEEDDQCIFVISEVRKFEQRLGDFRAAIESSKANLNKLASTSFDSLEKRVLSSLNIVEDFCSDMVATTSAQKEEIEVLKERILSHFSQLEYAKSLVERSRDPRYLEHLRSRPLDPSSQQKFEDIKKLHNYLKNQVAECRRHFYEQNRKADKAHDRVPCTQLIYLTLANHSKIIRRLKAELDNIKEKLGLGRHNTSYEEAEYLSICEANFSGMKKLNEAPNFNDDAHEITLNDLTAGISKVKLNRDSDCPDKKPVKLANRKLMILKRNMSEVRIVKVKADDTTWTRALNKCASRPKPLVHPDSASLINGSSSQIGLHATLASQKTPTTWSPSKGSASTSLPSVIKTLESPGTTVLPSISPSVSSTSSSIAAKNTTLAGLLTSPLFGSAATKSSSTGPVLMPATTKPAPATTAAGGLFSSTNFSTATSSATGIFGVGSTFGVQSSSSGQTSTTTSQALAPLKQTSGIFDAGAMGPKPTVFGVPTPKPVIGNVSPSKLIASSASKVVDSVERPAISVAPVSSTVQSPVMSTSIATKSPPSAGLFASSTLFNPVVTPSNKTETSSIPSISSSDASSKSSPVTSGSSSFTSQNFGTATTSTTNIFGGGSPFGVQSTKSDQVSVTTTQSNLGELDQTKTTTGIFSSPGIVPSSTGFGIQAPQPVAGSASPSKLIASSTPNVVAKAESSSVAFTQGSSAAQLSPSVTSGSVVAPTNTSAGLFATPSFTSPATTSSLTGFVSSVNTSDSVKATPTTTITSGLFSSPGFGTVSTSTTSIFGGGSVFGVQTTTSGQTNTTTAQTGIGAVFAQPKTTTGIFGTTSTGPSSVVFGSPGIISAPKTTTNVSPPKAFASSDPSQVSSVESSVLPVATLSSPVSTSVTSTAVSAVSNVPSGLFASSPFSAAPTTVSLTGTGFMSSLSISDPANKSIPSTTSAVVGGGLFSSTSFGAASTSAASIFGGGSSFGVQASTPSQTNTTTTQAGLVGGFGQNKSTTGLFGTATTGSTASVFGGSATFGSSSPFGSNFGGGGSAASTFGSAGSGIFGNTATSTSQSTGFGTLAQQSTTTSAFGGSPFGGGTQQQQASVFGAPAQQKPPGGLFSSSFASPASPSAGVFGGGAFSTGNSSGGVAQQGFGFSQNKPAGGTGFGSPPVFGGGATFGTSSPFGSSFAASPASTFPGAGGSVFGGGVSTQNVGFGALAQQGSTSPGFGSTSPSGPSAFGVSAQPQVQQPSLFGTPQPQQQQAKPGFGGQAFSSWR